MAQKSAETDDPGAADLYEVGTLAQVLQLLKLPDGTIKVLVEGVPRAPCPRSARRDGRRSPPKRTRDRPAGAEASPAKPRRWRARCRRQFEQYVKTNRKLPPELLQTLAGIDDPTAWPTPSAAHLGVRLPTSSACWKPRRRRKRLELLVGFVDGEIDVQQMEKRIRGRVKSQMEKSQREYYLNEQMKAIQKELGDLDDAPNDMDELARRIAEAGMPKAVEAKAKPS